MEHVRRSHYVDPYNFCLKLKLTGKPLPWFYDLLLLSEFAVISLAFYDLCFHGVWQHPLFSVAVHYVLSFSGLTMQSPPCGGNSFFPYTPHPSLSLSFFFVCVCVFVFECLKDHNTCAYIVDWLDNGKISRKVSTKLLLLCGFFLFIELCCVDRISIFFYNWVDSPSHS